MAKLLENPKPSQASAGAGLSPRYAAAIASGFALLAALLSLLGAPLERLIGRTIEFRAREALGRGPELDPSLKVFAFDDEAAAVRGGSNLEAADWAEVITRLASRAPRSILLDRPFPHPVVAADGRHFVDALAHTPTPLIGKALVSPNELAHLSRLMPDRFGLGIPRLVPDPADRPRRLPRWAVTEKHYAFGPSNPMGLAFAHIGHGEAADRGSLRPLLTLADTVLMPHWSFFAAGEPRITRGQLIVGDVVVDMDEDDDLPLNLVAPERVNKRVVSLAGLLREGEAREQILSGVKPGDTLVILSDLRQGSTPYAMTAVGPMPAAYLDLAAISSAVSGRWLAIYPGRVPVTMLFCILLAFLAHRLDRRRLLVIVVSISACTATAGVLAFALGGAQVPWFPPVATFLAAGLAASIAGFRQDHVRLALLRRDLDGRISPDKLQAMLDQDSLSRLEATEQVVTIMFIDIVGFSRAAEKQTPKEAFSSLKGLMDQMRGAVHAHGGVVDRTMGDGMLCVFGFDVGGEAASGPGAQHAIQAVTCAAEIQRENLRRMRRAQKTQEAVFPIRVGVNTTGVYLGNLGDQDKTDLTVIGSGVNFAQRLEAACDRHMVMVGAATRDIVQLEPGIGEALRKRHIRVKHSQDLVEAYELDPFCRDMQLLLDGDEAYRQAIGIERAEIRWPVPYPGLIRVSTTYGDGEMVNFSTDGFTIKLSEYYAKDVPLTLRIDTIDGELGARLERSGLDAIMLEVRWARPSGSGYVHGCQTKSLSKDQREEVIGLLREIIQRHRVDALGAA